MTRKTIKGIAVAVGFMPELDGKSLFLKSPESLATRHGYQAGPELQSPLLLTGFHSGRRQHIGFWGTVVTNRLAWVWTLCTTEAIYQARGSHWCNSGTTVIGTTKGALSYSI